MHTIRKKNEIMNNISKKCRVALILTTIFRVLLQMGIPVYMRADMPDDDLLMVEYAETILNGEWLGNYGVHTLNKNPMFSLFLALSKTLNLPYMLALGLGYSFAALVFFLAIRRFIKNDRISYVLYLFVLFSPVMFDINIAQKVYRNSIVPMLVLLVVSCYLVLYAERNSSYKTIVSWAVGDGVAFAAFYLVREDSVWLGCFAAGATILIAVKLLLEQRQSKLSLNRAFFKRIFCLLIPVVICFLGIQSIKLTNYIYYGVYVTTDFKDTAFADMGKAILSVQPDEEIEYVWVPRSTIEKLYEVSPTLATIRTELDRELDGTDSFGSGVMDGETEKDYVMWAIRWAARDAGLYETAQKADEFYRQVCDEIETALDEGILEKRDALILSNLSKPVEISEIPDCLNYLVKNFFRTINYYYLSCQVYQNFGAENDLRLMSYITNTNPVVSGTYQLSGWAFAYEDDSELVLEIVDADGNAYDLEWSESSDVWEHFSEKYDNAENCRFSFEGSNRDNTTLNIYLDEELVFSDTLASVQTIDTEKYVMFIDSNEAESTIYSYSAKSVWLARLIITIYQKTGYLIAAVALTLFIAELVWNILRKIRRQKVNFAFWIIKAGLLLTMFTDMMIVSVNYYAAHSADSAFGYYTPGVYPVWQVFVCLCFVTGVDFFREIRDNRRIKSMSRDDQLH